MAIDYKVFKKVITQLNRSGSLFDNIF